MMVSGDENTNISVSQYLRELKSNISAWEDIVIKTQKLNVNLKGSGQSVTNIVDSVGILCGAGYARFSGLDKVTQLLSEVTVIQRYISEKMCTMNRALQNDFTDTLSRQVETWRRSVATIKRERDIDGRKAKVDYKKSFTELTKLEKKVNSQSGRKQSLSNTLSLQLEYASQDLQNKERYVEELERCVLRKAICEERGRYRHLVESLRPLLEAQLSMRDDLDRLQLVYDQLYSGPFEDLSAVPLDVEAYVKQYQVSDHSRASSFCSVYSRTNSQLSLGGSNLSSSVDDFVYQTSGLSLHSPDQLDSSSSTIHDLDYDQRRCEQQSALRYSNLRQLKHTSEKKYVGSTLPRHVPPPYLGGPREGPDDNGRTRRSYYEQQTLPPDSVSPHYDDHNLSLSDDHPLPPDLPQSHYDDSTLTRLKSDLHSDPNKDLSKDTTSTFRRRKPSNITAMEAPTIMNKQFYEVPSSLDRSQWGETGARQHRVTSSPRDAPDVRHSVDLSSVAGRPCQRGSRHSNFWNNVANETVVTRGPPSRGEVPQIYAEGAPTGAIGPRTNHLTVACREEERRPSALQAAAAPGGPGRPQLLREAALGEPHVLGPRPALYPPGDTLAAPARPPTALSIYQ